MIWFVNTFVAGVAFWSSFETHGFLEFCNLLVAGLYAWVLAVKLWEFARRD